MDDTRTILNDDTRQTPAFGAHPSAVPGVKKQSLELFVLLSLIVPSMVLSYFALQQGRASFDIIAAATILRDLALVALVAYFLWSNHEPVSRIGWNVSSVPTEIVLGILLFVPLLVSTNILEQFLRAAGLSGSSGASGFLSPTGRLQYLLACLLVAVVAVAEETIFRGYLILRFQNVTRSTVAAVLLSAFVFSLGHGYEGAAGVVTVGAMGIVFALVYLWRRSLVAPMVMHFLQDFFAIVVLPLLAHKH
jgi:membrane protease YdiL (CAAX protease family)